MYEVEVKVPADLASVRDRVAELDATALGAVIQEDTYYDAPHRSFAESDEALRVRRERTNPSGSTTAVENPPTDSGGDDRVRVTYKGPLVDVDSKTREEIETDVEDGEALDAILARLGFEAVATVRKERERYRIGGYTVALDAVADVGEYVEVETEATEGELDTAREGAFALLERLGLDPDDGIRTSYLELLLAK